MGYTIFFPFSSGIEISLSIRRIGGFGIVLHREDAPFLYTFPVLPYSIVYTFYPIHTGQAGLSSGSLHRETRVGAEHGRSDIAAGRRKRRIGINLDTGRKMKEWNDGFSLVETLTAVLLVTLTLLFLMKASVVSLHSLRNSGSRFRVSIELSNRKHAIQGNGFDQAAAASDRLVIQKGSFQLRESIIAVNRDLKKITLTGSTGNHTDRLEFYLSRRIQGGGKWTTDSP